MAIAMKCDICGSLYETYEYSELKYSNALSFERYDLGRDAYSSRIVYDCCPDCLNEIAKTIELLKK